VDYVYRESRKAGNTLFVPVLRLLIRERSMVLDSKTIYLLVFPIF